MMLVPMWSSLTAIQDGNQIQEIAFWYATQKAADLTKTIMESIH